MEDFLYHYTSRSGLLGIIESKTIWASNIHYLNDYTEFLLAIDQTKLMVRNPSDQNNKLLVALYNKIESELEAISRMHVFAVSFSADGDVLSQWRGYCPNGQGYSIGFSKSIIANLAAQQGFTFKPCIYDWKEQRRIISEPLKRAEDLLSRDSTSPDIVNKAATGFISEFLQIAPLLKDSVFYQEHEWRLFSYIPSTDNRCKTREGATAIIPYVEFCLDKNASLPMTEVVVGPGQPGRDKELALSAVGLLLSQNGFKERCVKPSRIPYRTT